MVKPLADMMNLENGKRRGVMFQAVDPKMSGQVTKVMVDRAEAPFRSFCTRMWLDYCDEHNDPLSAPNRLDRDAYVAKYTDWLWQKYLKERYVSEEI